MRTSDDTRRREDVNFGLGHVRGVVADRLIYQDAHVFLSGDVLELNDRVEDCNLRAPTASERGAVDFQRRGRAFSNTDRFS